MGIPYVKPYGLAMVLDQTQVKFTLNKSQMLSNIYKNMSVMMSYMAV